jgi:putative nucleotidyltransferase with HDIG domain
MEASESIPSQTQEYRSSKLSTFWRWLVEPSAKIKDPAEWRNARLLSVFLLILFALFLAINILYWVTIPGYKIPGSDLAGYVVLALTYWLSRSRFTRFAVLILLIMFPLNVFSNVMAGTTLNLEVTLSFLIPSYILASIFLRPLWTGIYGYGINLVILMLPFLAKGQVSGFTFIIGPLSVGVVTVTLCIISMVHRDHVERDRQADLKKDYDNTLKGWSRALEVRDQETEGHSRRVTDLALQLARACGLHGEDLEHLYRGGVLHDIGKMAIPDSILFKPTSLNTEEWEIMHTHPKIAYEMFSSIPFLQPALVVPAYHHEWWNGTGYPFGLEGEQIPLPARIFAIVDVWDALLSDRPYRKAWTKEKATAYLKEQSGKQFDPKIVERFFALDL